MSAAAALRQARAAGIQIRIDGEDLMLEASAPPPAEVLDLLGQHKADILTLLRPGTDGWSGEDWREFFEERAGIAEFNGGLPRDQAEAQAFSCCVGEWLHRNPVRSLPGQCDRCGESRRILLPYLTGYSTNDPGHTWLHQECSPAWHQARRAKAVSALVAIGINIPAEQHKSRLRPRPEDTRQPAHDKQYGNSDRSTRQNDSETDGLVLPEIQPLYS